MTLPIDEPLHALGLMSLCAGLAWASLCRINSMSQDTTRKTIRASYALLFTGAVTAATMPVWLPSAWAEWSTITLAGCYLVVMVTNSAGWRHGPPPHARTQPGALGEALVRQFQDTEAPR